MPPLAATLRSLDANLLVFLGVGFFFEPEGRGLRPSFAWLPSRALLGRESLPACHTYAIPCSVMFRLCSAPNQDGRASPSSSEVSRDDSGPRSSPAMLVDHRFEVPDRHEHLDSSHVHGFERSGARHSRCPRSNTHYCVGSSPGVPPPEIVSGGRGRSRSYPQEPSGDPCAKVP